MARQDFAEELRQREYIGNVQLALAERPGKFMPYATTVTKDGDLINILDEFGHLQMEDIQVRNGNTVNTDPDVRRRWLKKPRRAGVAPLIDPDDRLSTSVDMKSPLVQGVTLAARRYHDDKLLTGFYGTAIEGNEDGFTSIGFKSGNVLAADYGETANSYTGLTLKKLRGIRKLAAKRFVDLEYEKLVMVITAEEVDDLLGIEQFVSGDYANNKALEHGEIRDWMGFTFIPAEITNPKAYPRASALAVNGSGHRRLPVWVRSGLAYKPWIEFEGHTDILATMNHSEQIAGYACGAGSRTDEDKCFIVETVD